MKSRIEQIIRSESLSNLQFAQALDINPASVTHILSGRNNPSLDIIIRIARKFPHYNLRWLLLGEGTAITADTQSEHKVVSRPDDLFSAHSTQNRTLQTAQIQNTEPKLTPLGQAHIPAEKLIICLPDGTYKEYIKQ